MRVGKNLEAKNTIPLVSLLHINKYRHERLTPISPQIIRDEHQLVSFQAVPKYQTCSTESFWRNIIGGSASSRFHRPPGGLGLGQKARAHIKSMRLLAAEHDFFNAVPDSSSRLLFNRSDNEAYLSYIPRRQYAVYFPNGGSVDLDLSEAAGQYVVKWLDISQSRWAGKETIEGGDMVTLSPPGTGHWVVWIGLVSTSQ